MAAFNLTAEINLRGPSNLNQVVGDIRRQLSTVSLNIAINPATARNIQGVTAEVRNLSAALRDAQTNAVALGAALRGLGASVGQTVNTVNSLGAGLTRANQQVAQTQAVFRAASSEMSEFGRQSALAIRRFAAFSVATGGVYALTKALSTAYSEFVQFNREFVRLQQVTDTGASGLKGLADEITRLSTGLGVSSKDLLAVSTTLAQAGLSAKDTKTALEALAKSALAPSFDQLSDTVEGSIAILRQFGLQASELEGALGSINAVAAKFAVEASDIITAIQRTGGVFATASKGVSEGTNALNEFVAVFTSIRATTRESAETIATGLRTIFTRIQRGSTIDTLREFGIELTDLQGKFVGPYEAVKRLSEGLSSLDPRSGAFAKIAEELGGFRQIGKVIPLIQQFATAQQALGVAQRGAGSLSADQAKAQEALAIRIIKVREQFVALVRDVGQSKSFQNFADISLKLASALLSVADAAKGVLPAIAAIAAIKGIGAVGQFVSGFAGGIGGGRRRNSGGPIGFATGGYVPGTGDSDTVPAMLTPGEFVIRKKAVEKIGVGNLHKMNKYAGGGKVAKSMKGVKGVSQQFNKAVVKTAEEPFSKGFAINDTDTLIADINYQPISEQMIQNDLKNKKINKNFVKQLKAENNRDKGNAFEEYLVRSNRTSLKRTINPIDPVDFKSGGRYAEAKNIKSKLAEEVFFDKLFRARVQDGSYSTRNEKPSSKGDQRINLGELTVFTRNFARGGYVQKLGIGGSPEELSKASRADLISLAKKHGIPYNYSLLGLRRSLSPDEQRSKNTFMSSLSSAILKSVAGEQRVSDLAKSRSVAVVGITGENRSEEVTTPGATSSTGASVRGVPVTLQTGNLPPGLARRVQALIRSRIEKLVSEVGNQIAKAAGTTPTTGRQNIRNITSKDLEEIAGSIFEKGLGVANGMYDPKAHAVDFPGGLNKQLAGLLGVAPGVMTDVTNNATMAKAKSKIYDEQMDRGRLEARSRFGKSQFSQGGRIQKFGVGGEAQAIATQMKKGSPIANSWWTGTFAGNNILFDWASPTKAFKIPTGEDIEIEQGFRKLLMDKAQREWMDFQDKNKKGLKQLSPEERAKLAAATAMTPEARAKIEKDAELRKAQTEIKRTSGFRGDVEDHGLKRSGLNLRRYASGGSAEDTVPALLTPGEFVINKRAAQRLGLGQLNRLNNADKISGFNKGGAVQRFAAGSGVLPARPENPDAFNISLPQIVPALQEISKALENLGISASSSAAIVQKGGATSVRAATMAYEADIRRLKLAGGSAEQLYAAERNLARAREQGQANIATAQAFGAGRGTGSAGLPAVGGGELARLDIRAQQRVNRFNDNLRRRLTDEAIASGNPVDQQAIENNIQGQQRKIRSRAYELEGARTLGTSRRNLRQAGVSGESIEQFINTSSLDKRTSQQMENTYLAQRRAIHTQEIQALRGVATTAVERNRQEKEINRLVIEDRDQRRQDLNTLRRERGMSGGLGAFERSPILRTGRSLAPWFGFGEFTGPNAQSRNAMSSRLQTAGLGLTFAGGLIGEGVGKAVGGGTGAAISAGASTFASAVGIGAMFGPGGAIAGAVVGLVAGFADASKAAKEYAAAQTQKRIQDQGTKLEKTFELLSKATSDAERGHLRLAAAAQIAVLAQDEKRSREQAKELAAPRFSSFKTDELTDKLKEGGKESSKFLTEFLKERFATGTSEKSFIQRDTRGNVSGITGISNFKEVMESLSFTNSDVAGLEAKRTEAKTVLGSRSEEEIKRLSSSQTTNEQTLRSAAVEYLRLSFLVTEAQKKQITELVNNIKKEEQANLIRIQNAAKATITLNLLSDALSKVSASSTRALSEFNNKLDNAETSLQDRLSGGMTIRAEKNQNLDILQNLKGYNLSDIRGAVSGIGNQMGASPELIGMVTQAASRQKVLEDTLPKLLQTIGLRLQTSTGTDLNEGEKGQIEKEISATLLPLFKEAKISKPEEAIQDVVTNLTEQFNKNKSLSYEELANKIPAINILAKGSQDALKPFIESGIKFSEANNRSIEAVNKFANALSQAQELQIKANNVSTQTANQIKQASGQPLSLQQRIKPFEDEIATLTSTIGENGLPSRPTIDPNEIQARITANRIRQSELMSKQANKTITGPEIEALGRLKFQTDSLSKAQQKLATDSSRASEALTDLSNLKQVKDNIRNGFLDILSNMNNPEAQREFLQQVNSFKRVMSGVGRQQDLPFAIPALRQALSYRTPENQNILLNNFLERLKPIIGEEPARAFIDSIKTNSKSAEERMLENIITQFGKTQEDTLKTLMGQSSNAANDFKSIVVSAGVEFKQTVAPSAQQPVTETIPAVPKFASGGMVYASAGKLIQYSPKGTDTVPAMLTPGEFVVNKAATDKNLGLLKAINGGVSGYSKGGVIYAADGMQVPEIDQKNQLITDLYAANADLQTNTQYLSKKNRQDPSTGPFPVIKNIASLLSELGSPAEDLNNISGEQIATFSSDRMAAFIDSVDRAVLRAINANQNPVKEPQAQQEIQSSQPGISLAEQMAGTTMEFQPLPPPDINLFWNPGNLMGTLKDTSPLEKRRLALAEQNKKAMEARRNQFLGSTVYGQQKTQNEEATANYRAKLMERGKELARMTPEERKAERETKKEAENLARNEREKRIADMKLLEEAKKSAPGYESPADKARRRFAESEDETRKVADRVRADAAERRRLKEEEKTAPGYESPADIARRRFAESEEEGKAVADRVRAAAETRKKETEKTTEDSKPLISPKVQDRVSALNAQIAAQNRKELEAALKLNIINDNEFGTITELNAEQKSRLAKAQADAMNKERETRDAEYKRQRDEVSERRRKKFEDMRASGAAIVQSIEASNARDKEAQGEINPKTNKPYRDAIEKDAVENSLREEYPGMSMGQILELKQKEREVRNQNTEVAAAAYREKKAHEEQVAKEKAEQAKTEAEEAARFKGLQGVIAQNNDSRKVAQVRAANMPYLDFAGADYSALQSVAQNQVVQGAGQTLYGGAETAIGGTVGLVGIIPTLVTSILALGAKAGRNIIGDNTYTVMADEALTAAAENFGTSSAAGFSAAGTGLSRIGGGIAMTTSGEIDESLRKPNYLETTEADRLQEMQRTKFGQVSLGGNTHLDLGGGLYNIVNQARNTTIEALIPGAEVALPAAKTFAGGAIRMANQGAEAVLPAVKTAARTINTAGENVAGMLSRGPDTNTIDGMVDRLTGGLPTSQRFQPPKQYLIEPPPFNAKGTPEYQKQAAISRDVAQRTPADKVRGALQQTPLPNLAEQAAEQARVNKALMDQMNRIPTVGDELDIPDLGPELDEADFLDPLLNPVNTPAPIPTNVGMSVNDPHGAGTLSEADIGKYLRSPLSQTRGPDGRYVRAPQSPPPRDKNPFTGRFENPNVQNAVASSVFKPITDDTLKETKTVSEIMQTLAGGLYVPDPKKKGLLSRSMEYVTSPLSGLKKAFTKKQASVEIPLPQPKPDVSPPITQSKPPLPQPKPDVSPPITQSKPQPSTKHYIKQLEASEYGPNLKAVTKAGAVHFDSTKQNIHGLTGWKGRLTPKDDASVMAIKEWLDTRGKELGVAQYKASEGGSFTFYSKSGAIKETGAISQAAEKELMDKIQLGLYGEGDTFIPGTNISGRFDARNLGIDKARSLNEAQLKGATHAALYKTELSNKTAMEGVSKGGNAGVGGVHDSGYVDYLKRLRVLSRWPSRGSRVKDTKISSSIESIEEEIARASQVGDEWFKKNFPDFYANGPTQPSKPPLPQPKPDVVAPAPSTPAKPTRSPRPSTGSVTKSAASATVDVTNQASVKESQQQLATQVGEMTGLSPEGIARLEKDMGFTKIVVGEEASQILKESANKSGRSAASSAMVRTHRNMKTTLFSENPELNAATLRHESGHALQAVNPKAFRTNMGSKELQANIKQFIEGGGYEQLVGKQKGFYPITGTADQPGLEQLPKELFAELLRGVGTEEMAKNPQAQQLLKQFINQAGYKKGGGLIYAANGRLIPYEPRGTDTVPAMLTPGEFVVNKQATQNNLPLLKAINNNQVSGYSNGGMVQYLAEGSNDPLGSSIMSGVSKMMGLDTSSLDKAFTTFNTYVGSLSTVLDKFIQGASSVREATAPLSSLENVVVKIDSASSNFNGAAKNFGDAVGSLNETMKNFTDAIGKIPQKIEFVASGSIPINITLEVNGGKGIPSNLTAFKKDIFQRIQEVLKTQMPALSFDLVQYSQTESGEQE